VYFRRLPDIWTTFAQDQRSHQAGLRDRGSTQDNLPSQCDTARIVVIRALPIQRVRRQP
jgi:hypothetical protein